MPSILTVPATVSVQPANDSVSMSPVLDPALANTSSRSVIAPWAPPCASPERKSTVPAKPKATAACTSMGPLMVVVLPESAETTPPESPIKVSGALIVSALPALRSTSPPSPPLFVEALPPPPFAMMPAPIVMSPSSGPIVKELTSPLSNETNPPSPSNVGPALAWIALSELLLVTRIVPDAQSSMSPPSPPDVCEELPFAFRWALLAASSVMPPPGVPPGRPMKSSPASRQRAPPNPAPAVELTSMSLLTVMLSPASMSTQPPSPPPPWASIGCAIVMLVAACMSTSPPVP